MDRRQFMMGAMIVPIIPTTKTCISKTSTVGPPKDGEWEMDIRKRYRNIAISESLNISVIDRNGDRISGCIAVDRRSGYALGYQLTKQKPPNSFCINHPMDECAEIHSVDQLVEQEDGTCFPLRLYSGVRVIFLESTTNEIEGHNFMREESIR